MSTCFLSQNGQIISTSVSKQDFLLKYPKGAFTTTRTVGQKSIFQLRKHIERLVESVRLTLSNENKDDASNRTSDSDFKQKYADILNADRLRDILVKDMKTLYTEANKKKKIDHELEITLLVTWKSGSVDQADLSTKLETLSVSDSTSTQKKNQEYDVFVHFCPLPEVSKENVTVKLEKGHRENAKAETSEWCRLRKDYESNMTKGTEEVVLMNDDGVVLEGLSSNFFVIKDGKVYSATTGVLPGTVQSIVFEVCEQANIPVEKRAPNFNDCREWGGALITSACRLALPVHHIQLAGKDSRTIDFEYGKDSVALKIENLVARAAARCSEVVFD